MMRAASAPGRVNLIGDHTDYTGGLVLPMAIDRSTTIAGERGGTTVELSSSLFDEPASVSLGVDDVSSVGPGWARFVAAVIIELQPRRGFRGMVRSTVPPRSGLSSSAALEVAVALVLGFEGTPLALAQLCQRAELRAVGVPCGIMDQYTSVAGVPGCALLIDCHTLAIEPVPMPADAEIVVVHSGQERTLAQSAYAERVAQCQRAEALIGPLRSASLDDAERIDDSIVRRRARHVVAENARVRQFAAALAADDLEAAGALMNSSHHSLTYDFQVSTSVLDSLCDRLRRTDGVYGARMTGAGFGGCVVALAAPGSLDEGCKVTPSRGAYLIEG